MRSPIAAVVFALPLFLFSVSSQGSELKVGGGAAPINNIFRKIETPFAKKTGIKLVLFENGPDEAIKNVDQGKLDLASAGLSSEDWLALAKEKNIELKNKDDLKFRVIGKDIVNVITHAKAGVKKLSSDQLKGIFTGKVKNWKELGGADQAIVVVFGTKIPGTHKYFRTKVMHEEEYAAGKKDVGTAPEVLEKVKATKGGVGLAPMGLDTSAVSVPEIPELGRPISVATKGVPSQSVLELFEFISGEGAKYLK